MDEKHIHVVVSGEPGVGKTAVIEFLARCLISAGIPAVFTPTSLNVVEEGSVGISTEDMNLRLESIKQAGDRLVVLEEIGTLNKEDLIKMLDAATDAVAE